MVATHPVLPKARRRCYRCSLPGLAEFTTCRLQGTKMGHHGRRHAKGKNQQFLQQRAITALNIVTPPGDALQLRLGAGKSLNLLHLLDFKSCVTIIARMRSKFCWENLRALGCVTLFAPNWMRWATIP